MARFKTHHFVFEDREDREGETPTRFNFKADIEISSDGIFYLNLPEDISKTLIEAGVDAGDVVNSNRRHGKIRGSTYQQLLQEVAVRFNDFFSKELVSEQFLLKYFIATSASYCKSADGEFLPNGEWQRQKDGHFSGWVNGIGPHTMKGTGVSVYCVPINRKVFQYKSGKQLVKDEQVHANHARDLGKENLNENLFWLACKPETQTSLASSEFHYIDATPEVCAFFVGLYKSLWGLNERIKEMTSPEQIARLAESKTKFLL